MRLTDHSARSAPTACWDGLRGTVRCSSVAAVEQALPKSRARAGGHGIVLILRACDWSKSLDFIGLWARVHCRIVVLKSAKSQKTRGSPSDSGHVDNSCSAMRFRHRLTVFAQALDVKPDRLADLTDNLLLRSPSCHATWQIRNVRGIVPRRFLNHDGVLHVLHSVSPACFMTLAHVPRGRSSPGLPAMVTVPGLLGCRYWR